MVIVQRFRALVQVVALVELARAMARELSARGAAAPSIEELRPLACTQPSCRQPARRSDDSLAIVGHGTYERHVRGLLATVVIAVRRFLCLACERTMSVLPDLLHPRRWYAAVVIVEALWRQLVLAEKALAEAARFRGRTNEEWRTLARWREDLLSSPTLWGWLGRRCGARGPSADRGEARRRLEWLLREHAPAMSFSPFAAVARADVWQATRASLAGVVHDRRRAWPPGRGPAGFRGAVRPRRPRPAHPTESVPDMPRAP